MILGQNDFKLVWFVLFCLRIMVINLGQMKIHFDLKQHILIDLRHILIFFYENTGWFLSASLIKCILVTCLDNLFFNLIRGKSFFFFSAILFAFVYGLDTLEIIQLFRVYKLSSFKQLCNCVNLFNLSVTDWTVHELNLRDGFQVQIEQARKLTCVHVLYKLNQ